MASMDTPIFLGIKEPGKPWRFEFPGQVDAWVDHLGGATGCELAITIVDKASEKTRLQEAGFHAMIRPYQLAKGWDVDQLKQWLLAQIFGTWTWIDERTGVTIELLNEPRTSSLSKAQYSELIERTMEIAANEPRPVILMAPDEYRLIKEQAVKRAAREEQKATKAAARQAAKVEDI